MNEAYNLLKDVVGFPEKQIPEMFTFTEENGEYVIKAFRYLDGPTFGKILRAIMAKGGSYRKDETTKFAIFTLPKQQKETSVEASTPTEVKVEEQGEYALSKSLHGKLGQLVPCLQDAEGITIDGFHRLKINPKAWTVKNDQIKTPVDRALARMTVNFCRRHYSSEEMKNDIGLLIGSGLTVDQIVEITGISKSTIYNYMPPEKKDKALSEAQKKGWEEKKEFPALETPLKTQETIIPKRNSGQIYKTYLLGLRECEKCGGKEERDKMSFIDNQLVCRKCAGKDKPLTPHKLEAEPTFKPKEKADFRVAQMHPQKSKFELEVIQQLQAEGLPLETDQEFCIQKTVPDAILKLKDRTVAIYIDNVATHEEGDERDEFLRSTLEKLYDFEICVVQYKNDSAEERQRAKETIKEFLRW
jgi:hypothetical protein